MQFCLFVPLQGLGDAACCKMNSKLQQEEAPWQLLHSSAHMMFAHLTTQKHPLLQACFSDFMSLKILLGSMLPSSVCLSPKQSRQGRGQHGHAWTPFTMLDRKIDDGTKLQTKNGVPDDCPTINKRTKRKR